MKIHFAPIIALATGFILSAHANVLVNDSWSDGTRTDPTSSATPPYAENNGVTGTDSDSDGNLESAWFGTTLSATTGNLNGTVGATSSSSWTTYFTDTFADSVNLANVGDTIGITWVFTMTGVNANNSSQGFHIGILQSPTGGRLTADGTPANQVYAGYGSFLNIGNTLGRGNNDNFDLMHWAVPGGANNILSTSAAYSKIGTGDGANGAVGYLDAVQYTYQFSAQRTASGLQIDQSISGGLLNGTGGMTNSFLDTTPSSYTFDTFALRPTAGSVDATGFDTTGFEVTFASVPEPATFALAGLGALAFAGYRRMRR